MSANTDLLINSITSSLSRVRIIFLINLSLCAVIITNIYLENASSDSRWVQYAPAESALREIESDAIEACLFNFELCEKEGITTFLKNYHGFNCSDVHEGIDKHYVCNLSDKQFKSFEKVFDEIDDRIDLQLLWSQILTRKAFVDNSLKDHKLTSTDVPFLGLSIPSNDLSAVCGLFMIILIIWLVFSSFQIDHIFADDAAASQLDEYTVGLRHSFLTVYAGSHWGLKVMAICVMFAPSFVMGASFVNNLISSMDLLSEEQTIRSVDRMGLFVMFKLFVELIMASLLFWTGWVASGVWTRLVKHFFP